MGRVFRTFQHCYLFISKSNLPKIGVGGKANCYDQTFTSSANCLVFTDTCATISVQILKATILGGSLFGQNKFAMEHSFNVTTFRFKTRSFVSWLYSKTQISSPDSIFFGRVGFIKQHSAAARTKLFSPNF
jgi:hypothetical protein